MTPSIKINRWRFPDHSKATIRRFRIVQTTQFPVTLPNKSAVSCQESTISEGDITVLDKKTELFKTKSGGRTIPDPRVGRYEPLHGTVRHDYMENDLSVNAPR